jgi:AcrR family transcriptional regulator
MTHMIATSPRRRKETESASRVRDRTERLGRMDWISAARDALIKGGVHAVKVDLIANRLKITRGSFYWHFENRAALLAALVELWESQNTKPFEDIAGRSDLNAAEKFMGMATLWLEEKEFDWVFDSAMRDWARSSRSVAKKLAAIDELRMTLFEQVFDEMGYPPLEAKIRARITYYHQVGYYTLAIREDKKTRRELFPMYLHILAGKIEMKDFDL